MTDQPEINSDGANKAENPVAGLRWHPWPADRAPEAQIAPSGQISPSREDAMIALKVVDRAANRLTNGGDKLAGIELRAAALVIEAVLIGR